MRVFWLLHDAQEWLDNLNLPLDWKLSLYMHSFLATNVSIVCVFSEVQVAFHYFDMVVHIKIRKSHKNVREDSDYGDCWLPLYTCINSDHTHVRFSKHVWYLHTTFCVMLFWLWSFSIRIQTILTPFHGLIDYYLLNNFNNEWLYCLKKFFCARLNLKS